jgi:hypothetical protein
MLMAYLTLITGLIISAVAIFYSVAGLATIFSAAVLPIIIMGAVLEGAKLVATVWLKQNWDNSPKFLKGYLLSAVAILMFITSMGIFGFLSKAHSDQNLVSGDVTSKISIIDEKIKTERDNIEAARRALTQLDAAVDQTMSRSSTEQGAQRAVQIRRQQQTERTRLQKEISTAQATITKLNEEAAPIRAELRKVEAEVGPIKYIAKFVYGDNPDANILEKAVTWVIILIVIVFDPLAVMLLLASQYTFAQIKKEREEKFKLEESGEKVLAVPSEPQIDLEAVNRELAEAKTEPTIDYSIIDPPKEEEKEEERPFRNKGEAPAMPLMAAYEFAKEEPAVTIKHTSTSMIVEDNAGKQEIPAHSIDDLEKLIKEHGYSFEQGIAKVNGVTIPADLLERLTGSGYVQNEEQKESDQWTKIVNKTITEEEYLKAVQNKKDA